MSRKNESEIDLVFITGSMGTELENYYFRKFTNNRADAQDLTQATFEHLLLVGAGTEVGKPEHFIRRTAHNIGVDFLRQQREFLSIDALGEADLPEGPPEPFDLIAREQEWELVDRVVQRLPPRCFEVFWMCRIEGHAHAAAAARFNIIVDTVKAHLRYASLIIARALNELKPTDE